MAEKIRVIIGAKDNTLREEIKSFLSFERKIKVMGEANRAEDIINMAKEHKPDIILVDATMNKINGMGVLEILTTTIPNILVIAIIEHGSKEMIKATMAAGAREFVETPINGDSLVDTIIGLYEKDLNRRMLIEKSKLKKLEDNPKIITIFSTKGGVGKSTIAANTAIALAKSTKERVALLDLDLQFGDIALMLNIYPKRTIIDLIKETQVLESDILEDYLVKHNAGIDIMPAPMSPEYAEYVTPVNIEKILRLLLSSYKYIVIDTAPSFNDINLTVLDMSDYILYVTTLDLPTIKNVKAGLHIMDTLKYSDDKVKLILNRYSRQYLISTQDVEKTTGKKILKVIPEDTSTIIQAVNEGNSFVVEKSGKPVAKSIIDISDMIIGKKEPSKPLIKKILRK